MIATKPKYEIGQEVSNGFICAIYLSRFYVLNNSNFNYNNWTKEDPNWLNKFIYCIKLNNPTKNLTFEEFQNFNPDLDYTILEEKYNALPLWYYITMPEAVINE